jgi:hypothetical protein
MSHLANFKAIAALCTITTAISIAIALSTSNLEPKFSAFAIAAIIYTFFTSAGKIYEEFSSQTAAASKLINILQLLTYAEFWFIAFIASINILKSGLRCGDNPAIVCAFVALYGIKKGIEYLRAVKRDFTMYVDQMSQGNCSCTRSRRALKN